MVAGGQSAAATPGLSWRAPRAPERGARNDASALVRPITVLDAAVRIIQSNRMSITLEIDEKTLASVPLGPGERERHMQIELACRFYAKGWLSLGQGARMAGLDHYAFGVALAERGIPRQYGLTEAQEDLAHARRR